MTDFVDVTLDSQNDITFNQNGDFELTEGFDTSLKVSLFADARAQADEVPAPQLRRGWWGNEFLTIPIGSKLWFLDQAVNNEQRLVQSINSAQLALQWLIDNNFADNVEVSGSQERDIIDLQIKVSKSGSIVAERTYQLWRNTLQETIDV